MKKYLHNLLGISRFEEKFKKIDAKLIAHNDVLNKISEKKELDLGSFEMDNDEEQRWLAEQWDDDGFRSYIKLRDLVLLKQIAICLENRDMQTALEINGRRLELLHWAAEAKKQFKLKN